MIPPTSNTRPDRATLIYRHYERLYRLAVLVAGDTATAATLVQSAYRQLPAEIVSAAETETFLVRALLNRRILQKSRWTIAPPDLTYTTLDRAQATALFRALAALPPPARLAIGLAYINGSSPAEIDAVIGPALGEETLAQVLGRFHVAAARAVGLVPAATDDITLARLDRLAGGQLADDQAVALRRDLLARPALRDIRDGMLAIRELLPRALPTLFAVPPPPALVDRLLELIQIDHPARLPRISTRRAQMLLAFVVLALAGAIIGLPSLLARLNMPTAGRALAVPELLDAAIHRFDRAPLEAGVLHEQYRVAKPDGGATLIERWYDYASPHRLAVVVSQEGRNGPPLMQISSDGRSLVQYRFRAGDRPFDTRLVDAHVSEAEAQTALTLLRNEPSAAAFVRRRDERRDVTPLYLAQARERGATFLGQTRTLDRPAFLLTYRTDQLPSQTAQSAPTQPAQVILTIDAQTYSLLDIAVVAADAAESSALRPLQVQAFQVLPSVPDTVWRLPTTTQVEQRAGLPSARAPEISSTLALGLDDALRSTSHALLVPQQLPDTAMRGVALPIDASSSQRVLGLYESEFQSLLLSPIERQGAGMPAGGEEHSAGGFRYRIVPFGQQPALVSAVAFRPEAPDQQVLVMLVDEYATAGEREAALGQIIASLTPVTEQNLPALRRNFYGSAAAGGQG